MEKEKHKLSTPRALYYNGSVASPPSAQTVMIETDSIIPLCDSHDDASNSNVYENDTSDSESTSYTESDEDYSCSESESTTDESDEEGLKNEKKFIVFESMLDQLFITCKTCGSLCEIKKSNTCSMVSVKVTCCNNHTFHWSLEGHNHSYITSQLVTF